jgi:hypothetical protein
VTQNKKTGPDVLATAENEYGDAKHENGTQRPPYCRKCVRERKMLKTGPDAHGTAENEFGSANMKTGPDALHTAEKVSGSTKHENWTRRPRYCRE